MSMLSNAVMDAGLRGGERDGGAYEGKDGGGIDAGGLEG
jgi:hypothetical protein